jgi:hypothetical protein
MLPEAIASNAHCAALLSTPAVTVMMHAGSAAHTYQLSHGASLTAQV